MCLDHHTAGPLEVRREEASEEAISSVLEGEIRAVPRETIVALWREGDAPPTGEAFLRIARDEGAAVAAALFRAVREGTPGYRPFEHRAWRDFGWNELSQGRAREAWMANTLLVEAYPESAESWRRLADASVALHDIPRAVELPRRSLALDPESAYVRSLIEELEP